jgi:hypothetical protein
LDCKEKAIIFANERYKQMSNLKFRIMKKIINYQGEKTKIDFRKENFTKVIDEKEGIQISKAHGTNDFIINGNRYTIKWELKKDPKRQRSGGIKLFYNGFSCPDNEKKMIEHIISVNGL